MTKPVVTVHDVDYLEVEYLKLPTTDLTTRYLTRISKPIELILDREYIEIALSFSKEVGTEEALKNECLNRWRKMIAEYPEGDDYIEHRKACDKLNNIKEVRLVEMELRRK